MQRKRFILICTISLVFMNMIFLSKKNLAETNSVTDDTITEFEGEIQKDYKESNQILLTDNMLKNTMFKRNNNISDQQVIEDWDMFTTNRSMKAEFIPAFIGTEAMMDQDKYNKLFGADNSHDSVGIYTNDIGSFEVIFNSDSSRDVVVMKQTISTIPGKEYTFSANTWSSTDSIRSISIYNGMTIEAADVITSKNMSDVGNQNVSGNFIAKSTHTTLSFQLYSVEQENVYVNISDLELFETYTKLSEHPKWLNSETDNVSKENTFLLRKTTETSMVDIEGMTYQPSTSDYMLNAGPANEPRKITFLNVGFYNGTSINAKLTLTPDFEIIESNTSNRVYIKDSVFLGMYFLGPIGSKIDVKYEFFDQNDEPVEISGYWTFSNVNKAKEITLLNSQIANIYSVNSSYNPPLSISYTENNDMLTLIGQSEIGVSGAGTQTTVTYDNEKEFSYTVFLKTTGIRIDYPRDPLVKVGFPDPQGIDQTINEITLENVTKLNYKFAQHIPFQPQQNRNQNLSWVLAPTTDNEVIHQEEWVVTNELGMNCNDLFSFNVDNLGNVVVKPVNISNSNLYNHYYIFERKLVFSGKEVDEKTLVDKEQGRYIEYNGEVTLIVDDMLPVTTNLSTSINLEANVNYCYLLTGTQTNIPGTENYPSKQTGLITHKYPIVTVPEIEDYQKVSVVPEDMEMAQLQYSQNQVTFNYDFIPGSIEIKVPEDMSFKEAELLTSKRTKVLREDPDWKIQVTDQRANVLREQWKLTARLNKPMTNEKGQTLDSVVKFKSVDGQPEYTLDTVNSVPIYQSEVNPSKVTDQEIGWTPDTGFYLDFDAYGFYPIGDYTAIVEFSLEAGPT